MIKGDGEKNKGFKNEKPSKGSAHFKYLFERSTGKKGK